MKYLKILILICFLLFSVNASAEFYKYIDENGNIRFTDDINMVPEAQRSKINSYVESEGKKAEENEAATETQEETEQLSNFPDLSADDEDEAEESLEDTRKRIEDMKAEIDKEYEALMEEKKQLDIAKKQTKTREEIEKFNERVDSHNKRSEAFMKKQEERDTLIEAYNTRITKQKPKQKKQ